MKYKCIECNQFYEDMDMHEIYYSPEIDPKIIPGYCKNCWSKKDDLKNKECNQNKKKKII